MQKISTCLWFDNEAAEAAKYYCSIFKSSKILKTTHYTDANPDREGSVMTVLFEIEGREILALNAGPMFKFNEAISLMVDCKTQAEVDYYWDKLSAGGEEGPCGWLKDKFGLSWQITPSVLLEMTGDPDRNKAARAMRAMMKMKKIVIADIERAHAGK
jgi:predicted 3-demethylubiquinone-9 3-methyltransferase (glyoxalase superfamily)